MVVLAGALKVQVAVAVPALSWSIQAESGPAFAQALLMWPTPVVAGVASHPAAPFGVPVGPLHEYTVYVSADAVAAAANVRMAAAGATSRQGERVTASPFAETGG